MDIRVGPPVVVAHADDAILVCARDGSIDGDRDHGFFVADTRFVSRWSVRLNGETPVLLDGSALGHDTARHDLTNPRLSSPDGDIDEHTLHLRVERAVHQAVDERYELVSYADEPAHVVVEIAIDSDFADILDVKSRHTVTRGTRQATRHGSCVETRYRSDDFARAFRLEIVSADSDAELAGGALTFHVVLQPGTPWRARVRWSPVVDEHDAPAPSHPSWVERVARFTTNDVAVTAIAQQAVDDLAHLRLHRHDERARGASDDDDWVPAAGVPWFVTLFGRDTLVVALQTFALTPRFSLGVLRALGSLQADHDDAWRDMEPGKIMHEVRHGELAARRLIPQLPYYGTHDATTLYVLAAARSWRWHGDRAQLDALRPNVERALAWIDRHGDRDGDGFQEYATRSEDGYYNQGWKDSGDAIVTADGARAKLPIATCELQGYVVDAKRAWADVLERVYGDRSGARALRDDASRIADLIDERLWWEDEGTCYLGLDGDKRPIRSVASNPGQLLWSRAVPDERARSIAARLAADDMWSGWGVRTLSARHRSYNPMSYQLGSVWPHDNALFATGCLRYGLHDDAHRVARALFDAARRFHEGRLPEVFAGFERTEDGFPVQYLGASVPQAWACGAVVQLLTAMLGLEPDARARTLAVRPSLPEWLGEIGVRRLRVGDASVDLTVRRDGERHRVDVERLDGTLEVALG